MSDACISCPVIVEYVKNGSEFVNGYMDVAYQPMLVVFTSLACLWAVWQGFKLVTGTTDLTWIATQFVFLFFGFGMLVALQYGLAGMVYSATTTMMFGIPGAIMGAGSGSDAITGLVSSLEGAFVQPFTMARTMMQSAGWFDKFGIVIFVFFLILPFVIMMAFFVIHVGLGLFRVMMVCLMAPYVIAMSAFPFGRDKIAAGISTLLTSILTLVSVTLVFLLIIQGIGSLMPSGEKVNTDFFDTDTWAAYILVILTAWSGVALVQEAVSLAGNLAQIALNAASPGMVANSMGQYGKAYAKGSMWGYGKLRDAYVESGKANQPSEIKDNSKATDALKSEK